MGELRPLLKDVAQAQALSRGGDVMPTSDELTDAKLATVEARTETRFVELSGKIDRLTDVTISSMNHLTKEVGALAKQVGDVRSEVKEETRFTRWTIAGIFVGTILAALAALWVTQGNLLSAFTAGIALKEHAPSANSQQ
jgi:hypothetical protein